MISAHRQYMGDFNRYNNYQRGKIKRIRNVFDGPLFHIWAYVLKTKIL